MNTDESSRAIREIASRVLRLPTLETRNSDILDFREIAVCQLREALEAAYEAGFRAAGGRAADDSQ